MDSGVQRRTYLPRTGISLQFLSAEWLGWVMVLGARVCMTSLGGRFPREEARDVETTRFISAISLPGLFVETAAVTLLHDVNAYCEIRVVVLM